MDTMYDSVNASRIPRGRGPLIAAYIDGDYAWTAEEWALFAGNLKMTITVKGNPRANAYDCENGDGTPQGARTWIQGKQRDGLAPCVVYASRARHPELAAACEGLGYYWWAADWTGSAHTVPGAQLVQYENNAPDDYDISCVYDDNLIAALRVGNRPWPW